MTTEQYQIGYEAGYSDGFDACAKPAQNTITVPKAAWDAMREALERLLTTIEPDIEAKWENGSEVTQAREAIDAANAASHPQATEPAGWKLVPVEPTQNMCNAARWSEYGEETSRQYEVSNEFIQSVWSSLLAAAPEAHHGK